MFDVTEFNESDADQWFTLWQGYQADEETSLDQVKKEVSANWPRILNDDQCHCRALRLKETGQAVGFANFLVHWCTTSTKDECYLYDLFVLPEFQGNGGGRLLIDTVIDFAKQNDLEKVCWETMTDNNQAQILYDKITDIKKSWYSYEVKI